VFDTHCHLDVEAFDRDRDAVLARAHAAGVTDVLVPAIRPATWEALVAQVVALGALAANGTRAAPRLHVALGIHPQIVPYLGAEERGAVDTLARTIESARAAGVSVVAVGECGLDGAAGDLPAQEQLLRAQVAIARELRLPLVVHVLRAHDQAPRVLAESGARDVGAIMHSYSGSPDLVARYRDLGFAFSFAGPVTYKNARKPLEALRAVPAELLLAETDAPDQTPEPHRGGRCEPAYVRHVVAALAAARGEAFEATAALTVANARRVLRLPPV
jgi:TatD DNase family protein